MLSMNTPTRARYSDVVAALEAVPDPERPNRVFDLLARVLDYTDSEIAEMSGISRATINAKRGGNRRSPIKAADVWRLADAFDLPEELFWGQPKAALQWLIDNGRLEEPEPPSEPDVVIPMVAGSSIGGNDNDTLIGDFAWNHPLAAAA